MNWQGVSADLPVALILMIVAAILGGLIIWIIKQWGYRSLKADYDQKVGEYGELNNQHGLLSTRHDDLSTKYNELNAKFLELQEKYDVQQRQLKECSSKRQSLQEELAIYLPFRKKYEDLQPQYDAAKLSVEQLNGEVNSLNVKNTGLSDALKDERKESMDLKNSLALLHGLQGKYDDLQPKYDAAKLELEKLNGELTTLTEENKGLKDSLEGERGENSNLKNSFASLDGLQGKYDGAQKEIESLKAKIAELEASQAATSSQGADKEAEILARIEEKAKNIDFGRIGIATIDEKDDLKIIKGIGPFIEKKLNALKLFTFRQIANFTEEDEDKVTDAIEFFPGRIRRDEWVYQAKNLLGLKVDKNKATLDRIKARAGEINFDRIGIATIADKDDLKLIKGIGPFIEKKLHSIGIYTFAQIARFTMEDEDKVNEVIEFFPGRIRRDGWQSQANSFVEDQEEETQAE